MSNNFKYSLLYVEDNPANLQLVTFILRRRPDIQLTTAVTGEEGLEKSRTTQPDLILLDINLPDISGLDVLERLKADNQLKDTPVVAVTANALEEDRQRGLEAGFLQYITKPLDVHQFLNTLNDLLPV